MRSTALKNEKAVSADFSVTHGLHVTAYLPPLSGIPSGKGHCTTLGDKLAWQKVLAAAARILHHIQGHWSNILCCSCASYHIWTGV